MNFRVVGGSCVGLASFDVHDTLCPISFFVFVCTHTQFSFYYWGQSVGVGASGAAISVPLYMGFVMSMPSWLVLLLRRVHVVKSESLIRQWFETAQQRRSISKLCVCPNMMEETKKSAMVRRTRHSMDTRDAQYLSVVVVLQNL